MLTINWQVVPQVLNFLILQVITQVFQDGFQFRDMTPPSEYSKEMNLRMILEGRAEVGGNFLAGIASDEVNADMSIDRMADTLMYAVKNKYVQPSNFYGVGGMKIFRDLIYTMQGLMKADHKFYKAHGQYDFPQKNKGRLVAMYLVGAMMSNPKIKSKMGNKMNEGMLMPYKGVMEKARKEAEVKKGAKKPAKKAPAKETAEVK